MTTPTIQHLGTIFREAMIRAADVSGDGSEVLFEAVYSTGAATRRYDWEIGPYNEELSIDPNHIRRDRLSAGIVPILLDHVPTVRNTVGNAVEDWITGGEAFVRFKMETGTPEADAIVNKLRQGIIKTVSVGYRVHKMTEVTAKGAKDKVRTLRAIDWEPWEISLTPIPRDAGATVRSEGDAAAYPCEIILTRNTTGEPSMTTATQANPTPASEVVPAPIETRAAVTPAPVDPTAAIQAAIEAERQRSSEIRNLCTRHAMDATFTEALVLQGRSVQEAGASILEALAARAAATPTNTQTAVVGHSYDDPAVLLRAFEDALAARVSDRVKPEGKALEFMGRGIMEGFQEILVARGERPVFNKIKLAERAFMSTSDLPVALGNAMHRVMDADYAAAPTTYKEIASQSDYVDFRDHEHMRGTEFPPLQDLGEGGEIKRATIGDGRLEKSRINTKAVIIPFTRELFINDSISYLQNHFGKLGRRVAAQENKAVWDYIASNPKMQYDNKAVFHADHGNLHATPVASPDVAIMSLIRAALRAHKSEGIPLNFSLKTLFVDPTLETDAEKLATALLATALGEVNPFSGKFRIVVEANLDTHNAWYGATDKADAPVITYGYLSGNSGPQVSTKEGWSTLGAELRVVHDFGFGVIGDKGIYKVKKS
ncbi:hypothetical protein CFBP5875_01430 [Agrobacterium pusense]|uniref:prohead protease/major capsid protein fusion protein n=1 Tax=Agrobacterium pusense TaxID=648995 RepID=UPI0010BF536E|nr:prohead protease/major capsid protein fusion protein [Agrobacterium pusense]QCL83354.1 hypothetical protein CFBP5875_01430 [Agrobacterium pusense]